jgi:hypothetical protein
MDLYLSVFVQEESSPEPQIYSTSRKTVEKPLKSNRLCARPYIKLVLDSHYQLKISDFKKKNTPQHTEINVLYCVQYMYCTVAERGERE